MPEKRHWPYLSTQHHLVCRPETIQNATCHVVSGTRFMFASRRLEPPHIVLNDRSSAQMQFSINQTKRPVCLSSRLVKLLQIYHAARLWAHKRASLKLSSIAKKVDLFFWTIEGLKRTQVKVDQVNIASTEFQNTYVVGLCYPKMTYFYNY